jgi:hypothetical protein
MAASPDPSALSSCVSLEVSLEDSSSEEGAVP